MLWAKIQNYYRLKRIERLVSLYNRMQPEQTPFTSTYKKLAPIVSRDALIHFAITLVALSLCSIVLGSVLGPIFKPVLDRFAQSEFRVLKALSILPMVIPAFLAIEIADYVYARIQYAVDRTFDFILPALGLVLLVTVIFIVKTPGLAQKVGFAFGAWRDEVNEKLQKRPRDLKVSQSRGSNWILSTGPAPAPATGTWPQPITFMEAEAFCLSQGRGWRLYNGDSTFVPAPQLKSAHGFYVWLSSSRGGQIEPSGIAPPKVFVSRSPQDRTIALCIDPTEVPR